MRQRSGAMGGWLARIAFVLVLLGAMTASATTPPTVLSATPGTDGSSISRFPLRFSEPMTPLGAKGDAPIGMACEVGGAGRWVDPTTYVWEFEHALPGGISCKAELKAGMKTLDGNELTGTNTFPIDTGGPFARAVLPGSRSVELREDQAFFVPPNRPVDRASVA